jgi:hypothetical protein
MNVLGTMIRAHRGGELTVVLLARPGHGLEVDVESRRGADGPEHEHRPRKSGDADPGGAHRGDLAVGGHPAEREQHAGEHAHRQRIRDGEGQQQAHEPGEGVEAELAGEQRPKQLAHDVRQEHHERE